MSEALPTALRAAVRTRANGCCEYCLLHEDDAWFPHEPDHIVATKHRGATDEANLAWTCLACNRHKETDLASIDEATGRPSAA
jgi:5-methylcytosine-specific restriction endonuclease McrA